MRSILSARAIHRFPLKRTPSVIGIRIAALPGAIGIHFSCHLALFGAVPILRKPVPDGVNTQHIENEAGDEDQRLRGDVSMML